MGIASLHPSYGLWLRPCWPLGYLDNVPVIPDCDDDRVGLLCSSLIGRRSQMELTAIPFAWHQGVVLDDRLFEHDHVALTGLDRSGNHRLVLNRGIVLRDHGGR